MDDDWEYPSGNQNKYEPGDLKFIQPLLVMIQGIELKSGTPVSPMSHWGYITNGQTKKTSANPLVSLGDMIWILVLTILCFFLESNQ